MGVVGTTPAGSGFLRLTPGGGVKNHQHPPRRFVAAIDDPAVDLTAVPPSSPASLDSPAHLRSFFPVCDSPNPSPKKPPRFWGLTFLTRPPKKFSPRPKFIPLRFHPPLVT